MTDDFGQQIQISVDQFRTFVRHVKSGELEETLLAAG
jgi:tripartite-type tricarboxylate transporter receptor subunit TctC